jgi:large subunit ribosomal protein L4
MADSTLALDVRSADGKKAGSVELPAAIFDVKTNIPLIHQVVVAQLAAARQGTHSTKRRGEVRGGGKKPWNQKGSGRARAGSSRSPLWSGGGVVFGPQPRDYSKKINNKVKLLALGRALFDRAVAGEVEVIEAWQSTSAKTKEINQIISRIAQSVGDANALEINKSDDQRSRIVEAALGLTAEEAEHLTDIALRAATGEKEIWTALASHASAV